MKIDLMDAPREVLLKYALDAEQDLDALKSENAELKARLEKAVELPCKVGDTIYFPVDDRWNSADVVEFVIGRDLDNITIEVHWVQYDRNYECSEVYDEGMVSLLNLGKTWFLTHEAAEARLKELEEE